MYDCAPKTAYVITFSTLARPHTWWTRERVRLATGFTGSTAALVLYFAKRSDPTLHLFVDSRYTLQARRQVRRTIPAVGVHGPLSRKKSIRIQIALAIGKPVVTVYGEPRDWPLSTPDLTFIAGDTIWTQRTWLDAFWVHRHMPEISENEIFLRSTETITHRIHQLVLCVARNTWYALTQAKLVTWITGLVVPHPESCGIHTSGFIVLYGVFARPRILVIFDDDADVRTYTELVRISEECPMDVFFRTQKAAIALRLQTFPMVVYERDTTGHVFRAFSLMNDTVRYETDVFFDIFATASVLAPHELSAHVRASCIEALVFKNASRYFTRPARIASSLKQSRRFYAETNYVGDSFPPIVAADKGSAEPHYDMGDRDPKDPEFVLIDTGAHYLFGATTDTTRVFCNFDLIRDTTLAKLRAMYTTVLRAQMALLVHYNDRECDTAPRASELDALCRSVIKRDYPRDAYKHGTGHGIAALGPVHNMHPTLSETSNHCIVPHEIFSVEPGVYIAEFGGVRLETSAMIHTNYKIYPMAFVPYEPRLVDMSKLTIEEHAWFGAYQQVCAGDYDALSRLIPNEQVREIVWNGLVA